MSAASWISLSVIKASGLVLALTTEENAERAQRLAEALLERHLVACVSIYPVRSFYRWEGALQCSHEAQLLMKTTAHHLEALSLAVSEMHSYDTPEWLCWPVTASSAYGAWAISELNSNASPPAA